MVYKDADFRLVYLKWINKEIAPLNIFSGRDDVTQKSLEPRTLVTSSTQK